MTPEEILLARTPHNIEAEQSVLGAMLLDTRCIPRVVEQLTPDDFYLKSNRELYETLYQMFSFSATIDAVTVLEELKHRGYYEEGVTRNYVLQLLDITPTAANVREYIRIVKERSTMRRVAELAGSLTEKSMGYGENAGDVLEFLEAEIFNIRKGRRQAKLEPISEILVKETLKIQERAEHPEEVPGLPLGLATLDRVLSGLAPSELILLAARPGMGKTSFALNALLHAGKYSGKTVAFFSLEMSKEQLADRLIASEAMVDSKKLQTGAIDDDEMGRVVNAASEISKHNIVIDDNPSRTVAEMNAVCRTVENLGLIVIDYLQLMQSSGNNLKYTEGNRQQIVSDISRSLKIMAKDLDVPVLCLSQLSRAVEGRSDKRPMLSDLRESGAIEQDADVVMFLYRESYYKRDANGEPEDNTAECIIAKNRRGETKIVPLMWLPQYMRFSDIENRYEAPY